MASVFDRLGVIYGNDDLDGLSEVMDDVSNVDDELKVMVDEIQTFIDGDLETVNVDEIREFLINLKDNLKDQTANLY